MKKVKLTKKNIIIGSSIIFLLALLIGGMVFFSSNQATFSGDINECYQENAEISTSCGGLDGGNYSANIQTNVYDDDWTNDGDLKDNGELNIIRYETPDNIISAKYKVLMKDYGMHYIDIPSECINDFVEIVVYEVDITSKEYHWDCKDDNNNLVEMIVKGDKGRKINDEAMIWRIQEIVDCWTISNDTCSNTPATHCSGGYESISDCELSIELGGIFYELSSIDQLENDVSDLSQDNIINQNAITENQNQISETQEDVANNTAGIEENRNNILFFLTGLFNLGERVDDNEQNISNNADAIATNQDAIVTNQNAISQFFSNLFGLNQTVNNISQTVDENQANTNTAIAELEYETESNMLNLNNTVQENKLRSEANEETISEILLSLFRLDGILGNSCWVLDDNYCVRDTVSEECSTFTSKRTCQEEVVCWEIVGDNCYNSHDSDCAGFSDEATCVANIPETTESTYIYTTEVTEQYVSNLQNASVTGNYSLVEEDFSLAEQVVNFWNNFWN